MDRKRLLPIVLIIFTNILGAGVILPVLPLYAEGEFAGTIVQITLLSTAFFAAQFVAAPVLGRLSDRYGRRPVLILSQVGTVLAFVLFIFAGPLGGLLDAAFARLPMTGGMIMLYVARILDGLTGGNITTAQAYVSDVTTQEQRAQGLGLLQAAFGAGFIFGPAFGGVLGNFGPVVPFIGAAIITTGTLLLTTFTLEESLPPEARQQAAARGRGGAIPLRVIFGQPALAVVLLITFFASLAWSALPATFSLYADHVLFDTLPDPSRVQLYIGLMLTFNGLVQVFTQLALLKRLIDRLGERRLLLLGEVVLAVGMAAIAPLTSALLVTLMFAPLSFGRGVTEPSLQSLVTRFSPDSARGQLLGIYQAARSLALIVGPVWAGAVYQAISPRVVWLVGGGLLGIAALLALALQNMEITRLEAAPAVAD